MNESIIYAIYIERNIKLFNILDLKESVIFFCFNCNQSAIDSGEQVCGIFAIRYYYNRYTLILDYNSEAFNRKSTLKNVK